jgi:predicted DNA-binding transcriptional regulator AlpA
MERLLLSVEEFGQAVGCGRSAAYQLISTNRVRTVRITPNGAIRIPVAAVQEFIDRLEPVTRESSDA